MSSVRVGQPPSAVSRSKRELSPAPTKMFGKTVKAREGWGPEHLVHLHRFITPPTIEIAGGRDAIHCRIHTHAAPRRK
ncbi:MAG TPA: hypothetical protein VMS96_09235 [Terriglobales bacterium]|nr:hypothetical protein [Terriglobales bacterium]